MTDLSSLSSPVFPAPTPVLIRTSGLLFIPAGLGLAWQVCSGQGLAHSLLALGLMLMTIEQARMAMIDLEQTAIVAQQTTDIRLIRFYRVLWVTITGELVGFYLAALGWLGWGAAIIMVSLTGFNLAAGLRLDTGANQPLQPLPLNQRLGVLLADGVALGLVILWLNNITRLWIGTGLLAICLGFQGIKLGQCWRHRRP